MFLTPSLIPLEGLMAAMYGADVAQLRALATQFDRSADRLDADRMSVGNEIHVRAWVGPVAVRFRAQWDSDHSRRLHDAAERLRVGAKQLRANAEDQTRTSALGEGAAGGGVGIGTLVGAGVAGIGGAWKNSTDTVTSMWGGLSGISSVVGKADLAAGIADWSHAAHYLIKGGHGAKLARDMGGLLHASKLHGVLSTTGSVLGAVNVAFGVIETASHLSEGKYGEAIWSGAKTAIGLAAVIPSPIQPFAAALSIGIGVGELIYHNREAIGQAAGVVSNAVNSAARDAAKRVSRVASNASAFVNDVGKAAAELWPW